MSSLLSICTASHLYSPLAPHRAFARATCAFSSLPCRPSAPLSARAPPSPPDFSPPFFCLFVPLLHSNNIFNLAYGPPSTFDVKISTASPPPPNAQAHIAASPLRKSGDGSDAIGVARLASRGCAFLFSRARRCEEPRIARHGWSGALSPDGPPALLGTDDERLDVRMAVRVAAWHSATSRSACSFGFSSTSAPINDAMRTPASFDRLSSRLLAGAFDNARPPLCLLSRIPAGSLDDPLVPLRCRSLPSRFQFRPCHTILHPHFASLPLFPASCRRLCPPSWSEKGRSRGRQRSAAARTPLLLPHPAVFGDCSLSAIAPRPTLPLSTLSRLPPHLRPCQGALPPTESPPPPPLSPSFFLSFFLQFSLAFSNRRVTILLQTLFVHENGGRNLQEPIASTDAMRGPMDRRSGVVPHTPFGCPGRDIPRHALHVPLLLPVSSRLCLPPLSRLVSFSPSSLPLCTPLAATDAASRRPPSSGTPLPPPPLRRSTTSFPTSPVPHPRFLPHLAPCSRLPISMFFSRRRVPHHTRTSV